MGVYLLEYARVCLLYRSDIFGVSIQLTSSPFSHLFILHHSPFVICCRLPEHDRGHLHPHGRSASGLPHDGIRDMQGFDDVSTRTIRNVWLLHDIRGLRPLFIHPVQPLTGTLRCRCLCLLAQLLARLPTDSVGHHGIRLLCTGRVRSRGRCQGDRCWASGRYGQDTEAAIGRRHGAGGRCR